MNAFEKKHKANLAIYQKSIKDILTAYDQELSLLAGTLFFDPDKPFSFDDYPAAKEKADRLFKEMHDRIQLTVESGIAGEWAYANSKNDALVRSVKGAIENLTDEQVRRYFNSHSGALDAFQKRRVSGLNLSQRVWNITEQNKLELETAIGTALTDGRSAGAISRDVRKYLNEPNKLFRKVRTGTNPDGTPKYRLSKAAQNYHPGQGVYRSSYKNAMRMAGTEINIAYRTADHLRYQDLDFVVGIDVLLSPTNHPDPDICDELKGRYPKEFKFTGWHPHCRCHVETVLKTEEEMDADDERMKQGLPPTETSVNQVTELPQNFQDWVKDNTGKIERAKSTPYFVADNLARKVDADGNVTYVFEKKPKTPKIEPKTPKVDEPAETKKPKAPKPNQGQIEEQLANQLTIEFQEEKQKLLTVAELEEQGVQFSGSVFKKAKDKDKALRESILGDFDFSTVFKDARKKLVELGIKEQDIVCEVELQPITSKIKIFTKGYECNIRREFQKKDGKFTVKHALMRLKPEIQGKGLSKEILKTFYEQYKKIGIDEIHVHANLDVGGYCWARYGFSARDQSQVINAVKGGGGEALKFLKDYYAKTNLPESAPFPMRLIAEQPWGKKALLGNDWHGFISLADKESCAIFERYVGLAGDTAAAAKPAKKSLLDIAKERHANRTPEQIKKIQEKATLRQDAYKAEKELRDTFKNLKGFDADKELLKFNGDYKELKQNIDKLRANTFDSIAELTSAGFDIKDIFKEGIKACRNIQDEIVEAKKVLSWCVSPEEKLAEINRILNSKNKTKKPLIDYLEKALAEEKKIAEEKIKIKAPSIKRIEELKKFKTTDASFKFDLNFVEQNIDIIDIEETKRRLDELEKTKKIIDIQTKLDELRKFKSTKSPREFFLKTQLVEERLAKGEIGRADKALQQLEEIRRKEQEATATTTTKRFAELTEKEQVSLIRKWVGDAEIAKQFPFATVEDGAKRLLKKKDAISEEGQNILNRLMQTKEAERIDINRHYVGTGNSFRLNYMLYSNPGKTPLEIVELAEKGKIKVGTFGNTLKRNDLSVIEHLDDAIARNKTKSPLTAVRALDEGAIEGMFGTKLDSLTMDAAEKVKEIKKGNQIGVNHGFSSVSLNPDANVFKHREYVMKIHIPEGSEMFITNNTYESEAILKRNAKYKIRDVKFEKGRIEIDVDYIG